MVNVRQICTRKVVTIGASADLATAARLMRDQHIGYLVVVEPAAQEGESVAIGVLTDRDIVISVVANDADPRAQRVGDVMTRNPTVVLLEDSVPDALDQMRRIGVRRLPVVGAYGHLHGVLSLDDILVRMADELDAAAGAIRREQQVERTHGP